MHRQPKITRTANQTVAPLHRDTRIGSLLHEKCESVANLSETGREHSRVPQLTKKVHPQQALFFARLVRHARQGMADSGMGEGGNSFRHPAIGHPKDMDLAPGMISRLPTRARKMRLEAWVTAMGISSDGFRFLMGAYVSRPTRWWSVDRFVGIDRQIGPVRILSVVLVITSRHTGNS